MDWGAKTRLSVSFKPETKEQQPLRVSGLSGPERGKHIYALRTILFNMAWGAEDFKCPGRWVRRD